MEPTKKEIAEELNMRSSILVETTNVLNMIGTYMSDETNSPKEDQDEAALNERLTHLVQDHPEMVGHIVLALGSLIVQVVDWSEVQEWLTFQENKIKEKAAEAGLHGHTHDN